MRVSREHRTAAAGIRDDGRIALAKGVNILSGESARAFEIACVRVQRATTHLSSGRSAVSAIDVQYSFSRVVDSGEKSIRDAPLKKHHRSARILRTIRSRPGCIFLPCSPRSIKQGQRKLKLLRNIARHSALDHQVRYS